MAIQNYHKRLLLVALLFFMAAPAFSQKEKLTRQQKKEAREAQLIKDLDSLIMNRRYDFYSTVYQETYGGKRTTTDRGGIEFYPRYCDVHVKRFQMEKVYPAGYAVLRTDEGWTVVFNLYGPGIDGNDYYDGVSKLFRFELKVDKAAKAVLRVTTGFNDHKYPHIYTGKVTRNTKN